MASIARRHGNTAIGVDCARVEALVPRVHAVTTGVGLLCRFVHDVCEVLCGEPHQEDPPMDNVAQFGGAHVRKGSGICCCIHATHE